MTHNSLNTTDTDEIEFTAGYGTTVSTTGAHLRGTRGHEPKTHAGSGDKVTNNVDVAAGTEQN